MKQDERDVVISGCGVLTPLGCDPAEVFDALCAGRSATSLDAGFDTTGVTSPVFGRLPAETDLTAGMRKDQSRYVRKNTKVMCRDTLLAVAASGRAVPSASLALGDEKSGGPLPAIDHARFGIICGAGFMPPELDDFVTAADIGTRDGEVDYAAWGSQSIPSMQPLWLLKFLPNMPSCHTGIIWDCQGPSNAITCDEASGLLALGEAFRHVARSTADIMFAGGTESKVNPSSVLRLSLLGRTSTRSAGRPESAHRPFDADRDGGICGEGAALMLLESADHVSARGGRALARVAGFGSACATTPPNVVEVSGAAIARALRATLRDAGLEAGDIDAVVAHGMAVPDQDVAEATAIREVLGDVPVTAASGGMGNVGTARGAINVAVACHMLARGVVPPIRNCEKLDPRCPIRAVTGSPLEKPLRRVLVVSAGIAGQAAALIVEKV